MKPMPAATNIARVGARRMAALTGSISRALEPGHDHLVTHRVPDFEVVDDRLH